ncbi:hypothetical protein HY639_04735 [Candidatus Woesearchaeota archaeon]|nr:hypothetical protein [Candidatus Woesearchaeota archaeon]
MKKVLMIPLLFGLSTTAQAEPHSPTRFSRHTIEGRLQAQQPAIEGVVEKETRKCRNDNGYWHCTFSEDEQPTSGKCRNDNGYWHCNFTREESRKCTNDNGYWHCDFSQNNQYFQRDNK